jgi:hypothetical protein
MPYQGSTQSVGFRNRAVSDSKVSKAESKAQALEKRRIQQVNEMEKVSVAQLTEMTRQDKQLTANDEYEIKNLAKFSKSLNEALEATAKTVGKAYIDTKRQEGINRARACHRGDESACAAVKLSKDQVNEIEAKIDEMREKTTSTADKIELEAELKKVKLSLEEKATALNIRKLGSNVAYGYRQGLLVERAKGYNAWLNGQLTPEYAEDGKTRIDREVTVTNDLDEEVKVRVGDFDKHSYKIQEQIVGKLETEFIELSDGGFNRNVVDTYLTQTVVKDTDKFLKDTQNKAQIDQAQTEKDAINNSIKVAFESIDSNPDGAKLAIQKALNNLTSIERRLGTDGSPRVAAKKALIAMLTENASFLSGKGQQANVDDVEDVLDLLEDTEFEIPGHGKVNLTKFWAGDLDIKELRGNILDAQFARITKEDRALNKNTVIAIAEAQDEYTKTGDKEVYLNKIKALQDTDLATGSQFNAKFKAALSWELNLTTEEKALKDAAQLNIKYKGQIPLKYTTKWPQNVVEKYKDMIVAPGDGIADTELAANALATAESNINDAVLLAAKNLSTTDRASPNIKHGIELIKAQIPALVKQARLAGDTRSNAELIKEIGTQIVVDIEADARGDGPKIYRLNENGTWENKNWNMQVPMTVASKARIQDDLRLDITNKISAYDGDIFQDKEQLLVPADSHLLTDVSYSAPNEANGVNQFWVKVAAEDPLERTSYELFNLERAKHGLEPIEWDQNTKNIIDNYNSQNKEIKQLLRSGITTLQERGIDLAGGISSHHMHSALIGVDGAGFISETELPTLLSEIGLKDMTYQEYLNSPQIMEKVQRYKVNQLIPLALSQTNNKMIAIRMIGAARNVPLDQAVAAMQNWNGNKAGDELDLSTAATLNGYLSGNTDNIKYVTTETSYTEASLIDEASGEINYSTLDRQPIPSNRNDAKLQLEQLTANPPQMYKESSFLHVKEYTPEYVAYEQRVSKLKSVERVWKALDLTTSNTKWTSVTAQAAIKNVIGKERWNELVKQAGGMPNVWQGKNSKKVVQFHNKIEALIRSQPEFRGGVE